MSGWANAVTETSLPVEELSLATEFNSKDLADQQAHDPGLQELATSRPSSLTLELVAFVDVDI